MSKLAFTTDYTNVYRWILLSINRLSSSCEVLYHSVVSYGILPFCRSRSVELLSCASLPMQLCGETGFRDIF
ncbi:hypothetical protein F2Z84_11965 [Bacteroides fragilis]|uniref:Uncharacterized protein n=1 Tax=Bacteroides fragilis TaxID=817 RepID=A0A5M5XBR2_BACFG|nr:hypothetical protein HMPREF0101_04086 [Bacteroides fragilis]KAA5174894.1 hypothetical protein F2Z30_21275 [Bacteroides fragilis]KAA5193662.1 hypothetical protein F2Z50_11210 [Bacteroides fragilis]KAA5199088.1 hypothetical protein F2Z24_14195 [Bacteroides fragilis]KAA5201608.1 hypothetical protein F2Z84_11965 [Bacteroides fragilis]